MSPGNVDDINPPRSMQNVVLSVMDYVRKHTQGDNFPTDFKTYDDALHVIWPELFKADPKAALLVSISIYIDVSERWGFEVQPAELKELRL